ncbi:MAG: hypothetical protein A4E31_01115 [Methanomassiliicoccales archaeon PtaU1.Bin030]|nr:MAG: hypothetical protein A4E31_01115 [Methanomassiliicoccales archaeon PtaU1.Bin030]
MSNEEWCPGIKEEAYEGALGEAWEKLKGKDLRTVAELSGANLRDRRLYLPTFGRESVIDPVCRSITLGGKEVKQLGAILVLHYLTNASSVQPSGRTVSYRQLPDGNRYYLSFRSRVTEVIGSMFRENPKLLLGAVKLLGAKKREFGVASVSIPVFPKLPVTVILWSGEDKVRGSANLLFDDTAPQHLSTEDLAAVGSFVVTQLLKVKAQMLKDIRSVNTL